MGGFGSTRWNWSGTKDAGEANPSLDINRLNRAGCLRPGYRGGWEWTRDGEQVASLRFWREAKGLSYHIGSASTAGNGGMSNSRRQSSGCRADSAALAHISSARRSSVELTAIAG
jgi:hypothetical protein